MSPTKTPAEAIIDAAEPDCVWPPGCLDLEPETCWCLVHGEEVPCAACEAASWITTPEDSA